jgi:hypothetical protein
MHLISSEGENIFLSGELHKYIGTVQHFMNNPNLSTENQEVVLPIDLSKNRIESIIEFLNHYGEEKYRPIMKPLDKPLRLCIQNWYVEWMSCLTLEDCFSMVKACEYLRIDVVLTFLPACIADKLLSCSTKEIEKIMNLTPHVDSNDIFIFKSIEDRVSGGGDE